MLENFFTSRKVFYAIWGIANGPLGGAVVLTNNSLVLHDIQHMASLFIHLSPVLVTWTMRWYATDYEDEWPSIFGMPKTQTPDTSFLDIFTPAITVYLTWLFFYIIWIVVYGRFQSKKHTGKATLYHYTMRKITVYR